MMITQIDEWIRIIMTTYDYNNPHIKISVIPPMNGWSETIKALNISDSYAGLSYKFATSGVILPVVGSEIGTQKYNKLGTFTQSLADVKKIFTALFPKPEAK